MFRLFLLVVVQVVFLTGGQVLLKKAMLQLPAFSWSWSYFKAVATDWWLLGCGISFGLATVLWLHILKHFPFSQAYPMTAMGYVFGVLAAIFVFGETVTAWRWVGVALIVLGCLFVMK